MRKLIIISRAIRIGMQGFFRHAWLTAAALLVMTVSLAIVLATVVIYFSTQNAIREVSKDLQQTIYLKGGVEVGETVDLQQEIIANPAVIGIDFITPQEGRETLIGFRPKLASAFEVFGNEDVLPPVLRVTVNDIDQIDAVRGIASGSNYQDLVASASEDDYSTDLAQKTIDRARDIRDFSVMSSVGLSLVFVGLSCLIIFNTIRIAIFSRRQEIEIMRLVGARPEFIRASFVVESCLAGLLAGLLAAGLIYIILGAIGDWARAQPEFVDTYDMFQQSASVVRMVVGAALGGVLAGLASAYWATRRYLKII